jgi:HD superfamily phosphohydrolase
MLFIRKMGGSLEEQIAGLLHDVAHTVFSHVSTYAFADEYPDGEYHEVIRDKFIYETEIADILQRYHIDIEYVLNEQNFSILENSLPDICADRIDYILRDSLSKEFLTMPEIIQVLNGIVLHDGSCVFDDLDSARIYCNAFFDINKYVFASAKSAYFHHKFAELMRYAIEQGVLTMDDWFTDDYQVVEKLKKSNDQKIQEELRLFNGEYIFTIDDKNPDFVVKNKVRIVDPYVLVDGKLQRFSRLDKCYADLIDNYKKFKLEQGTGIRIIHRGVFD